MKQYERYIKNVQSGGELVCELTRLAVERHLADLKKKDWGYYFDEWEADKAVGFLGILRHPSGGKGIAGERFKIQDNQAFITAMLFGWREKGTGQRRFKKCYLEVSRKWGKSLYAGFVELYVAYLEGQQGGAVLSAATTRKQAEEVFNAAVDMVTALRRDSMAAKKDIRAPMANSINILSTGCRIIRVSAEAGDIEGKNPVCATVDEYHAHPTDKVLELVISGMGTWDAPMLFIITTAGYEKEFPCYRVERPNAVEVLKGNRTDYELFAIIFGHDTDDADGILELDPDEPEQARQILKLAKKSNPNLGSTPTEKFILNRVRDARNKGGSTRVGVLVKNFNCWVDAPKVWIPEENIKAVMRPIDISDFYGRDVFLGLDLAATTDLTALAIYAPGDSETPAKAKVLYWLPEETVNKRNDVAPYREWVEKGYIQTTPGNIVDYGAVKAAVYKLQEKCQILSMGYDEWNAWETTAELTANGITMEKVLPRFAWQSNPTKRIEMMVMAGEIELDESPVLLWNFRNIALDRDSQDNIKPNKQKSGEKIDGVAAMVDAVFVWLQTISQPSGGSYLFDESTELIVV